MSTIGYRTATWERDSNFLKAVRQTVFVEEQGVPPELDFDEFDIRAIHILAVDDALPVGTARILASGQIGRMAVLKEYRRQGIGQHLLQLALQETSRLEVDPYVHAQITAIEFYERNGFKVSGPKFEDAGIMHHLMVFQNR